MAKKATTDTRGFKVNVVFHGQEAGQDLPPTRAYLFDRSGKLLASELVANGQAAFRVNPAAGQKVLVGPDLLAETRKAPPDLEARLVKAKAVTQDVIPQLAGPVLRIPISSYVWGCWWETCIVVHGTVRKLLNPGQPNPQYATICTGTVQIFQVDLGCTLDQLASFEVLTLRDRIVDILRGNLALVEKMPPFLVNPNPPDPGPDQRLKSSVLTSVLRAGSRPMGGRTTSARSASLPSSASDFTATSRFSQINMMATSMADSANVLSTLDASAVKEYLIVNRASLWNIFCVLIPDEWFCWQELGEVTIQSDGSFSAEVCFWCPEDFPDLYFEVVQNINGVDREVSDPQIACSTYYNYDGSQSVDIVVDDPTAVACLPEPGRPIPGDAVYVWPTAIGNDDLHYLTDVEGNPGVSTSTTGLLNGATPWGGTMALQMIFDPNLKTSTSVRYYRWSYKFDGDGTFTQISTPVTHRYMTVSYVPYLTIQYHPVTLGPNTVGGTTNLFEVPDPHPSDGWIDIDDPWDRPFAYFDSTGKGLGAFTYNDTPGRRSGLCTLMLEMFDAAGNLVPCDNLSGSGHFVFVLPDLSDPTKYTSLLTSNNITASGQLTFRVRVDNNDTYAALTGVDTPVACLVDCDCGIRNYNSGSDLISIDYAATHPNNFLTWGLSVTRGTVGTVASAGGATSSPPWSLPFPSLPGIYKRTAADLLGSCVSAAFAVNLDTYAEATDGYGTQTQYNRSATLAFALIHS
jgi:hypothetical protein